jgi:hypothetical protein
LPDNLWYQSRPDCTQDPKDKTRNESASNLWVAKS